MANLSTIIDRADESTLVLLDEVAGGTDPEEGAALSIALLETLAERGGLTLATTHLTRVAASALEMDAAGQLTALGGAFAIGEGELRLDETAIEPLRAGRLVYTFEPEAERFVVDQLKIDADRVRLDGAGFVQVGRDDTGDAEEIIDDSPPQAEQIQATRSQGIRQSIRIEDFIQHRPIPAQG